MIVINLTPHDVVVLDKAGDKIKFPASGKVARVDSVRTPAGVLDTAHLDTPSQGANPIELFTEAYGKVVGLPPQTPSVCYLVSQMVRVALPARSDLLSPGDLVRDERGNPTACRGLVRS
jgi:hypothetical protein